MPAFLYEIVLQWKLNLRSKEFLVHFYAVPLIFYVFIGGVFTSINPQANKTLISAMAIFGITMGGVLGSPYSLVEFYGGASKKAYQAAHIPLWTMAAGNVISGFLHLFVMSMLIFATAPLLFQAQLPASLPSYFAGLILTILSSLSIGTVFGLAFKSSSKAAMATQVVFLPSIMLSGLMFPTDMLPEVLQYIGRLFPATWGFRMMCGESLNFGDAVPLAIIIAAAVLVCIVRLFKLRTD